MKVVDNIGKYRLGTREASLESMGSCQLSERWKISSMSQILARRRSALSENMHSRCLPIVKSEGRTFAVLSVEKVLCCCLERG